MTLSSHLARLSRQHIVAGLLAGGLVIAGMAAVAQTAPSPSVGASAPLKSTVSKASAPDWKNLSAEQQSALKPLAANWQSMSAGQKRKWLELSKNYSSIAPAEQAKLHSRMSDWSSLSSQQRAQARINYAENQALTSGLTPEQRKVQWQAYQLLSPEEKNKLAANSAKTTLATAPSTKPTNILKNAPQPQFGTAKVLGQQYAASGSKIAVAPHLKKSNSILPQTTATVSATTPPSSPAVDGSAAVIKQ